MIDLQPTICDTNKEYKIEIVDDKTLVKNIISFISNRINEYNSIAEEHVAFTISPFEVVQEILLHGTGHSGGNSTMQKIKELGLNSDTNWEIGDFEEEYDLN